MEEKTAISQAMALDGNSWKKKRRLHQNYTVFSLIYFHTLLISLNTKYRLHIIWTALVVKSHSLFVDYLTCKARNFHIDRRDEAFDSRCNFYTCLGNLISELLKSDEVVGNLVQLHNSAATLSSVDLHHLSLHMTHYCLRKACVHCSNTMHIKKENQGFWSFHQVSLLTRLLMNKGIYEQRQKDNRGIVIVHQNSHFVNHTHSPRSAPTKFGISKTSTVGPSWEGKGHKSEMKMMQCL
ncbi:unnamed protein product [Lactuca saligna]|uniref:Uncharacterized protein n=1 Tax=Lactuca saligna TaxID=75948 RepID=A0AA35ZN97_LACSI|nr:unnamed protein product [Lactuca saligna]